VEDSGCPGTIRRGHEKFEVHWIPRPTMKIVGAETSQNGMLKKPDICVRQDALLDLTLHGRHPLKGANSGVKPFTVEYNILKLDHAENVISVTREELSAAMGSAQIRLRTNEPGTYRYEFMHLSDAIYDDPKNLPHSFVAEQIVRPLPTAKFIESSEPHLYCADTTFEDPSKNGIPISITGTMPVTIQVELRHELDHSVEKFELKDITERKYFFVPPQHTLTHGRHILKILEATDSAGCVSQLTQNNRASFTVADEASIVPLEPQHDHCVGDRISFSLQGTSPWQIEYEFNGRRNIATTSTPVFSRIAEQTGNMTLISIADRASNCKSFIEPGTMEKIIHEVPSVRTSEGSNTIENIREGTLYSYRADNRRPSGNCVRVLWHTTL
jgi:nucleoporin POM152